MRKELYLVTIFNSSGSIIAEYYRQSESYRKAICNVLVNERPEIETGYLIDCKKVEVQEA